MNRFDQSWTLFLDRDGVINRRIPDAYVTSPNEFELMPGVLEALPRLRNVFGKIVVVTNQRGISRGIFSEEQLRAVHDFFLEKVTNVNGRIDAIYVAPGPNGDPHRKPQTGMAMLAQKDFPEIDFTKSVMVGDSSSDMAFGRNIGAHCVFITTDKQTCEPTADEYHASLWEWVQELDASDNQPI